MVITDEGFKYSIDILEYFWAAPTSKYYSRNFRTIEIERDYFLEHMQEILWE